MKELLAKASGVIALGIGAAGLGPLLVDLYQQGTIAYSTCAPVLIPVWTSLIAVFAYFAKSPLQK